MRDEFRSNARDDKRKDYGGNNRKMGGRAAGEMNSKLG